DPLLPIRPERRVLMLIGVPREIKAGETRVAATPAAVRELVARGHRVMMEHDAGAGIGAADEVYAAAGATIAADAPALFAEAEMVMKIKEPRPAEWALLRSGQILFAYLHLAADRAQTEALLAAGITAIAYETVT